MDNLRQHSLGLFVLSVCVFTKVISRDNINMNLSQKILGRVGWYTGCLCLLQAKGTYLLASCGQMML